MTLKYKQLSAQLKLAQCGDAEAFAFLYQSLFEASFYYAYQFLGNAQDAQDVVQDSMITLYENLDSIRKPESLLAFSNRIVKNNCIDLMRKQNRTQEEDISACADKLKYHTSPEVAVLKDEQKNTISSALFHLPIEQREVLVLYYYMELNTAQIAKYLSVPASTVRNRLARGRAALKRHLSSSLKGGFAMFLSHRTMRNAFQKDASALLSSSDLSGATYQKICAKLNLAHKTPPSVTQLSRGVGHFYTAPLSSAGAGAVAASAVAAAVPIALVALPALQKASMGAQFAPPTYSVITPIDSRPDIPLAVPPFTANNADASPPPDASAHQVATAPPGHLDENSQYPLSQPDGKDSPAQEEEKQNPPVQTEAPPSQVHTPASPNIRFQTQHLVLPCGTEYTLEELTKLADISICDEKGTALEYQLRDYDEINWFSPDVYTITIFVPETEFTLARWSFISITLFEEIT